jgi:hypothetical protein
LMIKIGKVRSNAYEIMRLCRKEEMSWALADQARQKCEEIIDLTTPIIFQDKE